MSKGHPNEPMLDLFIYETSQNIEQLEAIILSIEKNNDLTPEAVNEIFRIMHTIKGSSAMMMYDNIASLSHAIEDLFYFFREGKPETVDCIPLSDMVLEGVDFIKLELEKIKNGDSPDGDPGGLTGNIKSFLASLKGDDEKILQPAAGKRVATTGSSQLTSQISMSGDKGKAYEAILFFEDGCEMENVRAFSIIHNLKDITDNFLHIPENIIDDSESVNTIREHGFTILLRTGLGYRELYDFFTGNSYIRELDLRELPETGGTEMPAILANPHLNIDSSSFTQDHIEHGNYEIKNVHQSIISVDVVKLDKLMDLMGEMVIAEAMVTQNPELQTMELNNFYKAARQLRKITDELQDMVMSIRMVPLSASFHKMHRVVRDVSRKLDKEAELVLIGEGTEVDKNIIEHISDPLMHLVRNAVDHGIEDPATRKAAGKPTKGQITLEAKNSGSDVLIMIRDDGKGLDKGNILKKARANGIIDKPESELTDKEIYNLILIPGFSTNDAVTEFSGRGVGMDVVVKNLEAVGGTVFIDSVQGVGTVTTLKIPLTLAIIDGMNIRVGKAKYTLPTTSIKETFQAKESTLIKDPEDNEMIMVRGQCYPVTRLHKLFDVDADYTDLTDGIMLMAEQDEKSVCLFADELLGQHQVVVKALPSYARRLKQASGLAGCTLLGDGSISLILNIGGLINI